MKTNWNNIPLYVWSIVYYKEDNKGNKKFYNYVGDCSNLCEGIYSDELEEMPLKDAKKLKGYY